MGELQHADGKNADYVDCEMSDGGFFIVRMILLQICADEVKHCQPESAVSVFCMEDIPIQNAGDGGKREQQHY